GSDSQREQKDATPMIYRHPFLWRSVWLGILSGVLLGCGAPPPVAETPPPPVTVSRPVVREVTDYDDYEGRIAAVEMVEVRARVRGHLRKVNFHDGQMVKEGDLLYEIDPRTYKASLDAAKAQFASAEASHKLAKSEHQRAKKLAAKGAGSKQDEEVWEAKTHTTAADTLKASAEVD